MAAPHHLDNDPVVTFGQHKEEGLRLSQLAAGYLRHLTVPMKDTGGDFIHAGRNWSELARRELKRRGETITIPVKSVNIEGSGLPIRAEGNLANQVGLLEASSLTLTETAIDDAAQHLLREFITRPQKGVRFTKWITEYTAEAATHGKHIATLELVEGIEFMKMMFEYRGYTFLVKVQPQGRTAPRLESILPVV